MIREEQFIHMRDIPEEMRGTFDLPWMYGGEVLRNDLRFVEALCKNIRCNPLPEAKLVGEWTMPKFLPPVIARMNNYAFLTDDYIIVNIYFGRCPKCGAVYWMKSAPPFKRLISRVMV
jgi:hypothetical protein